MSQVTVKTDKLNEVLVREIAAYWNNKTVTVSGGVGAHWSDFAMYERTCEETDPETGEVVTKPCMIRDRVPGTHDEITAISGVIHAIASGNNITFTIDYQVTIGNID